MPAFFFFWFSVHEVVVEKRNDFELERKKVRFRIAENINHLCFGCGGIIHDRWILRVEPDFEWHAACLKCAECQQFLDESSRCFVRDDKIYCKRDYDR